MLEFVSKLGFLALIALVVLLLIHILKPNYQQKIVTSAYVWQLSLKYRKKRISTNRIRNILIIICQVLILTTCSFMLAQPIISNAEEGAGVETIAIIDASASMLAANSAGVTRFERAVNSAHAAARDVVVQKKGAFTIILAAMESSGVLSHSRNISEIEQALDALKKQELGKPAGCTYGVANIDDAMDLASKALLVSPKAKVMFFTCKQYEISGKVEVVNVDDNEWNASILSVVALTNGYMEINPETGLPQTGEIIGENLSVFEIEAVSYGKDILKMTIHYSIEGAVRAGGESIVLNEPIIGFIDARCVDNKTALVHVNERIVSFSTAEFWIGKEDSVVNDKGEIDDKSEIGDSFRFDNRFSVLNGKKDIIRIQYVSTFPKSSQFAGHPSHNVFIRRMIDVLASAYVSSWDIRIKETFLPLNGEFEGGETDLYIFENVMPTTLPADGAVLMINPDKMPDNVKLILGEARVTPSGADDFKISLGEKHQITNYFNPKNVQVRQYLSISQQSAQAVGYESILLFGDEDFNSDDNIDRDAALLIKNSPLERIAVMPFSLNYSQLVLRPEWGLLMTNLFNYLLPSTIDRTIYEVGEIVEINARGVSMSVIRPDGSYITRDSFPFTFQTTQIGGYTLNQLLMSGETTRNGFFVKIAESECNFVQTYSELVNPFYPKILPDESIELLIWFAYVMFALLFIERLLHTKDEF